MIAADFVVHAVPPWVQFIVSGFGYLLAAITLGVLMVEFHLNVRKDRRIDRLERRLRRSRERCGFLATQNRALFERLDDILHQRSHRRAGRCRVRQPAGRRT